jgi:hypothetical protein
VDVSCFRRSRERRLALPVHQFTFKDGPASEHSPVITSQFPVMPEYVLYFYAPSTGILLSDFRDYVPAGSTLYRKTTTEIIGAVRGWEYREVVWT